VQLNYMKYSAYKTCPGMYRFKWVDRPAISMVPDYRNAWIGFTVQKIVETYYLEKWYLKGREALPLMLSLVRPVGEYFIRDKKIIWSREAENNWFVIAAATIPVVLETLLKEVFYSSDCRPELLLNFMHGVDKIWGKLDLVFFDGENNSRMTLLDGKAGGTVGKNVDKDQLLYYAWCLQRTLGRLPDRVGFWWYRHDEVKWIRSDQLVVDDVVRKVDTTIAGIKASRFPYTPSSSCRYCDFRSICNAGQKYLAGKKKDLPLVIPGNLGSVSF